MVRSLPKARILTLCLAALAQIALPGCSTKPDRVVAAQVSVGDLGEARKRSYFAMQSAREEDRLLTELRFGIVALADGYPRSAEPPLLSVFRTLREQGLNEDRTLPGVFIGEAARIWKGEPFEQAMAYYAIAAQQGMLGEWGNMRAAASGSLFLLKNFQDVEHASDPRLALAQRAARRDSESDAYLDAGYQPIRTDFALGYLMHAIASRAMGRTEEARDNLLRAHEVAPWLEEVIGRLHSGEYDTVLLIEFGLGPEKIAYGPDGILTRFVERTRSGSERLIVQTDSGDRTVWPWTADVNSMSSRMAWRGLDDIRQLRSAIGSGMTVAGAVLLGSRDRDTQLVGLGLLLGGLLTKATSQADIRACEVLPQRVYVVPLQLHEATRLVLQVEGRPQSRMVLPLVPSGSVQEPAVHLIRIPDRASRNEQWLTSGVIRYANEWVPGRVPGDQLPWILGGTCVHPPTHEALRRYQASGWLRDMTLSDLQELYRLEGISWDIESTGGIARGHILEGGSSLVAPVPASAGFLRLFTQPHPEYRPRSPEVRRLRGQIELELREHRP
ncbi:MAG: hypothetical protein EA380_07660 [Phycisphaeraceae bacterium]|nr:MAG: hypothetical protein EA380_07660 [Phycisphaeraceae bacterium]